MDLHYFDKDLLIAELVAMTEWLDEQEILSGIVLDYIADMSSEKAVDDGYRGNLQELRLKREVNMFDGRKYEIYRG